MPFQHFTQLAALFPSEFGRVLKLFPPGGQVQDHFPALELCLEPGRLFPKVRGKVILCLEQHVISGQARGPDTLPRQPEGGLHCQLVQF